MKNKYLSISIKVIYLIFLIYTCTLNIFGQYHSDYQQLAKVDSVNVLTLPTFAKIYNDTIPTHKYWICADFVQSTVDSGYIGIGSYQKMTNNKQVIQYFKLDKNGNLIWVREMPEFVSSAAYKIIPSQHGYLISFNYNNVVIMEIDEQGNKLWGKQFLYTMYDTINNQYYTFGLTKFIRAGQDGYVGYGTYNIGASSNPVHRSGLLLLKIDTLGNVLWEKEYAYTLYPNTGVYIRKMLEDISGNIYLSGSITNAALFPFWPSEDGLLIKIDPNGNHQWSSYYSSNPNIQDVIQSFTIDNNSDVIFSAYSRNNSLNTVSSLIAKIDGTGNVINSQGLNQGYQINVFNSTTTNNIDCFVINPNTTYTIATFDASLAILNQKTFDFKSVYTIKPTLDNKFAICSGRYPFNAANNDYRYNLFKVSYTDNSCIDTNYMALSLNNPSITLNTLPVITNTTVITASDFLINSLESELVDSSICPTCTTTANITPSGATTFCAGDTLILSANTGMMTYSWNNGQTGQSINVSQTGNYAVTVTDNYACTATSQNIPITVNPLPNANAGTDISMIIGNNTPIGGSPTSTGSVSYSWSPSTNLSDSSIANPIAAPLVTTTYTVFVTNNITGCVNSDDMIVNVSSVAIDKPQDEKEIKIYPNPTERNFVIEWQTPTTETTEIEISNTLGQIIYKQKIIHQTQVQHIDLHNVPKGIYSIKVNTQTKKLILE